MKKFNVKENMSIVISDKFKNSIKEAVELTSRKINFATSIWDKKFLATIITFNPINKEIQTFTCFGFNDSEVTSYLNLISKKEDYKNNQLVKIIKSDGFTYHGYVNVNVNVDNVKTELNIKYMEIYISIIDSYNDNEILECNFSVRTGNCLYRAGIKKIEQLKNMSFEEISKVRNLGRNSINEIEEKLNIKFI